MPFYVNVDGLSFEFLEFMGYTIAAEDDEFVLLDNKGTPYLLPKQGPRFLYVEDPNDADIFRHRPRIPMPPSEN